MVEQSYNPIVPVKVGNRRVPWLRLFGQSFRFLSGKIVQLVVVVAVGM